MDTSDKLQAIKLTIKIMVFYVGKCSTLMNYNWR